MSLPDIPNSTPHSALTRQEVINMLISSIALEETSLSRLINAESDKIQYVLKMSDIRIDDILQVNRSVERMLRSIIKNQMLLQFKLEDALELQKSSCHCEEDCEHCQHEE